MGRALLCDSKEGRPDPLRDKRSKRKPYPLPHMRDLLKSLGPMRYAKTIDLSMGYYHMHLTQQSKKLCTIILPWGKYCYNSLPMGYSGSSDIFQHELRTMFGDLGYVLVCINDIIVVGTGSFDKHTQQLKEVLTRSKRKNLQVNPLKSFWAKDKVDYLGFVITQDSIMPQIKKVQGIRDLTRPKNVKQL